MMKQTIIILNILIMSFIYATNSLAQEESEQIKNLTLENRKLAEENRFLKKRIRFLEVQLGGNLPALESQSSTIIQPGEQTIDRNDLFAREVLLKMAESAENYAKDNYGSYPVSIDLLTETTPPYLTINYCDQTMSGFVFTCDASIIGYTLTATPVEINITGSTVFEITTGKIWTPEK